MRVTASSRVITPSSTTPLPPKNRDLECQPGRSCRIGSCSIHSLPRCTGTLCLACPINVLEHPAIWYKKWLAHTSCLTLHCRQRRSAACLPATVRCGGVRIPATTSSP